MNKKTVISFCVGMLFASNLPIIGELMEDIQKIKQNFIGILQKHCQQLNRRRRFYPKIQSKLSVVRFCN